MAELTPYPFSGLARRMFRELEECGSIFDLEQSKFFLGDAEKDFSVRFHGHRAATPLGPAAGPHTQMAQNIVLAWLGGSRIMELKTVQILDELDIPRPCIDMRTIGFNAEWSQELKLEQSLDEYVKASMLVEMLRASGALEVEPGFGDLVYDMSVGYDLKGIKSDRVQAFIGGVRKAGEWVERFRREIPKELAHLRDCSFPEQLSTSVTLSTFHGCPPDEIEQIIVYLMEELGLNSVIKFNPMLLGPEELRGLLHDSLGYDGIRVPDTAFERDATWEQAVGIVERLQEKATSHGLGLGVKFSNTLIVGNDQGFLPAGEKEVYLSGPPLHVLAMHLVRRFRRHFGDRLPISFSAGVDRTNFPDAVALGLVPVTVCSDLLKKGGYGRLGGYHAQLARRMDSVGATNVDDFIVRAYGEGETALLELEPSADAVRVQACRQALAEGGDLRAAAGDDLFASWVSAAKLRNTEHYVETLAEDARYSQGRNAAPPKKIGRHLKLFDCLTCDLCVPVCPNDANFTFYVEGGEIPITKLRRTAAGWQWDEEGLLTLEERHQIGTFADFCNECGNCDVFCPEDGGPYVMKPRFFRRAEDWREATNLDGFQMAHSDSTDLVLGRFEGREFELEVAEGAFRYRGDDFEISFQDADPAGTVAGEGPKEIDLTYCFLMDSLRRAVLLSKQVNYINSQFGKTGSDA